MIRAKLTQAERTALWHAVRTQTQAHVDSLHRVAESFGLRVAVQRTERRPTHRVHYARRLAHHHRLVIAQLAAEPRDRREMRALLERLELKLWYWGCR